MFFRIEDSLVLAHVYSLDRGSTLDRTLVTLFWMLVLVGLYKMQRNQLDKIIATKNDVTRRKDRDILPWPLGPMR